MERSKVTSMDRSWAGKLCVGRSLFRSLSTFWNWNFWGGQRNLTFFFRHHGIALTCLCALLKLILANFPRICACTITTPLRNRLNHFLVTNIRHVA